MHNQTSSEDHRGQSPAEVRAAVAWNISGGVRRHGPAFAAFAEVVGHVQVLRDPDLFRRSLVGNWPSIEVFVEDYVQESGLLDALDLLPSQVRPFAVLDHEKVAEELRRELIVLEPEDAGVWVFDARRVVNSTVEKPQR